MLRLLALPQTRAVPTIWFIGPFSVLPGCCSVSAGSPSRYSRAAPGPHSNQSVEGLCLPGLTPVQRPSRVPRSCANSAACRRCRASLEVSFPFSVTLHAVVFRRPAVSCVPRLLGFHTPHPHGVRSALKVLHSASRHISYDPHSWDLSRLGRVVDVTIAEAVPSLRPSGCFPLSSVHRLITGFSPLGVPLCRTRHLPKQRRVWHSRAPRGCELQSPYPARCILQRRVGRYPRTVHV